MTSRLAWNWLAGTSRRMLRWGTTTLGYTTCLILALELAAIWLEDEIAGGVVAVGEACPAGLVDGDGVDDAGGVDGEAGSGEDAGAAELFLVDEGGVLSSVRADLHQDGAGTAAADAVLEDDEADEDEAGGGWRGGCTMRGC